MKRLVATIAGTAGAVLAAALMSAAPASTLAANQAPSGAGSAAAVPATFQATSLTWISLRYGWVLGTARCGTKICTKVIGTTNAGKTWRLVGTIRAPIPQIGNPGTGITEIRFATTKAGWAFGPGLYRTLNGGRTWTSQRIPGGGKQILDLATTATGTYAVVSQCKFASGLCSHKPLSLWRTATTTRRAWTKIKLNLPSNNTADVAARGKTVYVVDAQRNVTGGRDKFYASTDGGRHFRSRPVPCDSQPDIALVQVVPTTATRVALLCVGNLGSPQPGNATKYAYRSANTGKTATYAGTMPSAGTTVQLAASPAGHLGAASSSGGSFIYINNNKTNWYTSVFFGDGGRGWNDIFYVTDKVGWVIYSPAAYFHGMGLIYTTKDAGRHWHVVKP